MHFICAADCKFNCHKKCAPQIPKDCQGEVKWAAPGGKDTNLNYIFELLDFAS